MIEDRPNLEILRHSHPVGNRIDDARGDHPRNEGLHHAFVWAVAHAAELDSAQILEALQLGRKSHLNGFGLRTYSPLDIIRPTSVRCGLPQADIGLDGAEVQRHVRKKSL